MLNTGPRLEALEALAKKLLTDGPVKQQLTHRRVRALFNKIYVLDSVSDAQHVWEHDYFPQFYIPAKDFAKDVLSVEHHIIGGKAWLGRIQVGEKTTDKVLGFEEGPLKGLVKVQFDQMDLWFQEDEPCYIHPKDPFKRVEIVPSTHQVRVAVDGETVAESNNVMMLFETLLPVRYYLPKTSVNWKYITDSTTTSGCPYKGDASYYNVLVNGKEHKDLVWWYKHPTLESILIRGQICFYSEKVDIWVDGVKQERPKTHFA